MAQAGVERGGQYVKRGGGNPQKAQKWSVQSSPQQQRRLWSCDFLVLFFAFSSFCHPSPPTWKGSVLSLAPHLPSGAQPLVRQAILQKTPNRAPLKTDRCPRSPARSNIYPYPLVGLLYLLPACQPDQPSTYTASTVVDALGTSSLIGVLQYPSICVCVCMRVFEPTTVSDLPFARPFLFPRPRVAFNKVNNNNSFPSLSSLTSLRAKGLFILYFRPPISISPSPPPTLFCASHYGRCCCLEHVQVSLPSTGPHVIFSQHLLHHQQTT